MVDEGQKLHGNYWEVLSFPGLVLRIFFLPSKRYLAVVLASLSDGAGQFAYVSPPRSKSKCSKHFSTVVVREGPCHELGP